MACLSNWLAVEEPKFTRKKKGASNVNGRDEGAWYVISVAAIKAEVHEQTLRHYERLGLISPARKGNSPHSPRLYSDRDIERVIHIRSLMRDLGVNLAGVEAILHMKDRMEHMQLRVGARDGAYSRSACCRDPQAQRHYRASPTRLLIQRKWHLTFLSLPRIYINEK